MDILLITPDHGNKINSFPWGVLSVGSYLTSKSYEVKILDGSKYSRTELFEKVRYLGAGTNLVGINCMSTDALYVKSLCDYIKEANRDCKIIVGGPHAWLQPMQTCAYKNIDFVAYSEGELTLDGLIDELKTGDTVIVTFTEIMAVYLGQEEAPSAEVVSGLARRSDGTQGAALFGEAQVTAKILELDKETRRVKLELPEEGIREATVREGVDLSRVNVGDTVTVAIASALVIEVAQ